MRAWRVGVLKLLGLSDYYYHVCTEQQNSRNEKTETNGMIMLMVGTDNTWSREVTCAMDGYGQESGNALPIMEGDHKRNPRICTSG